MNLSNETLCIKRVQCPWHIIVRMVYDNISSAILSVSWLILERPIYFIWLTEIMISFIISTLLLIFLQKWKIYEGDLMFFNQCLLMSEIGLQASTTLLVIYHLYNGYMTISEFIPPRKCYLISQSISLSGRMCCWNLLWISADRYVALVRPMSYNNRLVLMHSVISDYYII